MKIEIPQFDLEIDRIKEEIEAYIEFDEEYVTYHCECWLTVMPDTKEGEYQQRDKFYYLHKDLERGVINHLELRYSTSNTDEKWDVWVITLSCKGIKNDIDLQIDTELKAKDIYAKILNWWRYGVID